MIKITELKRACNEVVSRTFPEIKVYGNDTVDGYTRPAFFTEIIPHGYSHESKSFSQSGATFKLRCWNSPMMKNCACQSMTK